jgi:hypothetical protein
MAWQRPPLPGPLSEELAPEAVPGGLAPASPSLWPPTVPPLSPRPCVTMRY